MNSKLILAVLVAAALSGCATQRGEGENLGRVLGTELARVVAPGYGPEARILGTLGQTAGKMAGRTLDASAREDEVERKAREQAIQDAAYDAERKKIDPNYVPGQRPVAGASRYGSRRVQF